MFFSFKYPHQVTRLRRGLVDHPYGGEPEPAGWNDPTHPPEKLPIGQAVIGPVSSNTSSTVTYEQSSLMAELYCPIGADILPGDRIVDGAGRVYEVKGYPREYVSPYTGRGGAVVSLSRINTQTGGA